MRNTPQDVHEKQIRELAEADGYSFVGWVDGYKGFRSKVTIGCVLHGAWSVTVQSFVTRGSRCKKCAMQTPQAVRENQLRHHAESDGYTFVGWVDGYKNAFSKAIINCPSHGDWNVTIANFVNKHSRCPRCGDSRVSDANRIPQVVREQQIQQRCDIDGFTFLGWVDDYNGVKSRFNVTCGVHGSWVAIPDNFLSRRSGCPSCAQYGYNPTIPGTLYALLSDCKLMIKIGITNKPDQRHGQLYSATPFGFIVYRQLQCSDGSQPRVLERMFHDQFPSVGLTGFDGATEWRQMSPDVTTWLDILGAK